MVTEVYHRNSASVNEYLGNDKSVIRAPRVRASVSLKQSGLSQSMKQKNQSLSVSAH